MRALLGGAPVGAPRGLATLARQVAESEGERLGWMSGPAHFTPIGFRLLGAISSPGLRYGVAAGFARHLRGRAADGVPVPAPRRRREGCALLAAFLVVALFLPNTRRRRGWWWDPD